MFNIDSTIKLNELLSTLIIQNKNIYHLTIVINVHCHSAQCLFISLFSIGDNLGQECMWLIFQVLFLRFLKVLRNETRTRRTSHSGKLFIYTNHLSPGSVSSNANFSLYKLSGRSWTFYLQAESWLPHGLTQMNLDIQGHFSNEFCNIFTFIPKLNISSTWAPFGSGPHQWPQ